MDESVGGIKSCVGGMELRLAPASIDILDVCFGLDSHQPYPPRARSYSIEFSYPIEPLGYPKETEGMHVRERERESMKETARARAS